MKIYIQQINNLSVKSHLNTDFLVCSGYGSTDFYYKYLDICLSMLK